MEWLQRDRIYSTMKNLETIWKVRKELAESGAFGAMGGSQMRLLKYEQYFSPVPNVPSKLSDYTQWFEQLDV